MSLLAPNLNRFVIFPIEHADIYKMYNKQIDCFWRAEEIDLSKDTTDWNKLTTDEKFFLSMVLAFFVASDGIVAENLALRFYNDVQNAEARLFYGFQMMMEGIHSVVYSLLIDTYIKNNEEKNKLLRSIEHFPCIQKKAKWGQKWIQDYEHDFATRLVAFACIEGIFFSGAFCSIFWLKKRGLLPGLCFSNELISRDESLHCEFAVLLYSKLNNKLAQSHVHQIIKDAVDIEIEFICDALPCNLIGMNSDLMSQYIQFVADRLSLQLGYNKIYNVSNPFDFMVKVKQTFLNAVSESMHWLIMLLTKKNYLMKHFKDKILN